MLGYPPTPPGGARRLTARPADPQGLGQPRGGEPPPPLQPPKLSHTPRGHTLAGGGPREHVPPPAPSRRGQSDSLCRCGSSGKKDRATCQHCNPSGKLQLPQCLRCKVPSGVEAAGLSALNSERWPSSRSMQHASGATSPLFLCRFQPVTVPEPSIDECIQILHGLKPKYEEHHKLKYNDDAVEVRALSMTFTFHGIGTFGGLCKQPCLSDLGDSGPRGPLVPGLFFFFEGSTAHRPKRYV